MNRSTSEKSSPWSQIVAPSSTLAAALLGSVLCWLAFPPVAWGALAWVGPIPWLMLISQPQLPGKRPYRALWLAGMVFWLLAVHWIRLPHPLNYLALLVLASYLGLYLPLFVRLSRVAVCRMKVPLWLAAPIVWTGLDWLRNHLMTGFGMGSLAHTQVEFSMGDSNRRSLRRIWRDIFDRSCCFVSDTKLAKLPAEACSHHASLSSSCNNFGSGSTNLWRSYVYETLLHHK